MKILAEISVGELYDKITILNIKLKKINDPNKLKNIKIELDALVQQSNKLILKDDEILRKNIQKLQDINEELWDIENAKRECEANKEFGEIFIKVLTLFKLISLFLIFDLPPRKLNSKSTTIPLILALVFLINFIDARIVPLVAKISSIITTLSEFLIISL